jgi:GNAT superfamily N-acetyltransferase
VRHSLCVGAFDRDRQVGFARVISDHATFAYVCDVFVLPSYRGRGVGARLMGGMIFRGPEARPTAAALAQAAPAWPGSG